MMGTEIAACKANDQPNEQQDAAMITKPEKRVGDTNGKEQPGDRIHHGLAREIVLALEIPSLVEELKAVGDVREEGLIAALGLDVPSNADLRNAIGEAKRIQCICDQYGCGGDEGRRSKDEDAPPTPSKGATDAVRTRHEPIDNKDTPCEYGEAGAKVRVEREAHQEPAQAVVERTPPAEAPQQEEHAQHLEERRRGLVPTPAAHAEVPAADGHERHGNKALEGPEHLAGQQIHSWDGEQCRQERHPLQGEPIGAEKLEDQRHVVDVAVGRAIPAGSERRGGAPFKDIQRVQAGIRFIHIDAGRNWLKR